MAITDELRKFTPEINGYKLMRPCDEKELLAIADRIDEAHEEALSRAYMDVSDSKWLRLPKDIDDKPIDEHDKVDWRDHSGTWHKNVLVVAVCSDGCYVMDGMVFHVHASDIRHYHAPTVEEMLLDMHRRLIDVSELYDVDSDELEEEYTRIIEEFAAELLLADDEKER